VYTPRKVFVGLICLLCLLGIAPAFGQDDAPAGPGVPRCEVEEDGKKLPPVTVDEAVTMVKQAIATAYEGQFGPDNVRCEMLLIVADPNDVSDAEQPVRDLVDTWDAEYGAAAGTKGPHVLSVKTVGADEQVTWLGEEATGGELAGGGTPYLVLADKDATSALITVNDPAEVADPAEVVDPAEVADPDESAPTQAANKRSEIETKLKAEVRAWYDENPPDEDVTKYTIRGYVHQSLDGGHELRPGDIKDEFPADKTFAEDYYDKLYDEAGLASVADIKPITGSPLLLFWSLGAALVLAGATVSWSCLRRRAGHRC